MSHFPPETLEEFERINGIKYLENEKEVYYDADAFDKFESSNIWRTDPFLFKKVKVSAVSLLKMLMHGKHGGEYEVAGELIGYPLGDTFYINDVISLPVIGTETRVNATAECDEWMLEYRDFINKIGFPEQMCGWYHTHPSYKCWLSGIDVDTERTHQKVMPWLAIVVDPVTTLQKGKVEIGAFRTLPEGVTPKENNSMKSALPKEKIQDFGAHYDCYYPVQVEIFKTKMEESVLNILWKDYWKTTLSSNSMISARENTNEKLFDMYEKYKDRKDMKVKDSIICTELQHEMDEIQAVYKRGLKKLEVMDLLFNQKK